MTNDLVKRLLDVASPLADEAAGTIHRLTAERDELYERWNDCQEKRMAAEAENARLRAELTKAADSLDWADAHLEDAGVVSANVRYGARDARAAVNPGKKTK
jgi:peptidyl-tRNA hydrolase